MSTSNRAPWEGRRIIGVTTALLLVMIAIGIFGVGTDQPGALWLVRATARASIAIFIVTFAASAINGVGRGARGKQLLRNRRYLGLSYATSHAFHTAALFWFAHTKGVGFTDLTSPATLVGGMIGNGLIVAMVLTSTDGARRRLGRSRWTILHRSGMYYLYAIFVLSYMVPALRGDPVALALMVGLLGALGLRVANRLRLRRAAASSHRS